MAMSSVLSAHYASRHESTGKLRCQIISSFADLRTLAPAWDRLWRSDPRGEVFQCFAWTEAWWESFGHNFELFAPVVFEENEVVLILPLVRRDRKLSFLGSPQADYGDLLCNHDREEKAFAIALEALLKSRAEWNEGVLGQFRSDSKIYRMSSRLPYGLRRLMHLGVTDRCPTIVLGEDKKEILDARIENKHVRRRLQKLRKAGNVTFHHLEKAEEAQLQFTQFLRCHLRRCAVLAKHSCFAEPEMQDLIRNLINKINLQKELRFGVLELNNRPIAWSLGFQSNGKYAYYQQTFDIDAEVYAPGDMLLHYLFLYAKEHVEREFDFLRGDEFFKLRVATHVNLIHTLYLERPGVRGNLRRHQRRVEGYFFRLVRQIEGAVRTHESTFHLFRTARRWLSPVLHQLRKKRGTGQRTKYLLSRLFHFLETAGWSTRRATVFQRVPEATLLARGPSNRVTNAKIGQLSDLADFVLQLPEIRVPDFDELRDRLKRGEKVYVVRQNGHIALLAWTRTIDVHSRLRHLSKATNALEMYECWPTDKVSVNCADLMSLLGAQALKDGVDLHLCCPNPPSTCVAELKNRGFYPKFCIVAHRVCRFLKYDKVIVPKSLEQCGIDEAFCPKCVN